ncbi:zinc finger BED domain-containing protein RICESLEEPER 2-like [Tripterygium wilfordii]|uniref:zinc finger BED domain-containing protein RICESLEEPER 2-like n=1 Tax=Tripterygium wilfordii TaxID=458696 RepID=UPI0018F80E48|nr:zinc finger BED domain-containing protein RICESLEEPER 2-like [Tripterygium wilfordii]
MSMFHCLLEELMESSDLELSGMTKKMKQKYDKYFGNVVKLNMLTIVAVILDPRHKMGFVLFALGQMYPGEVGVQMKKKVQDITSSMFEEYRKMVEPQDGSASKSKETMGGASSEENVNQQPAEKMKMLMVSRYKKFRYEIGGEDAKSDLDKYLGEEVEDDHQGFNILKWWKDNGNRFSIVANMARDVLAIPISIVASKSTFSTGGRVLDPFRSSLTPTVIETLICTQDWLRGSREPVNVEEKLEYIEKIEKGICKMTVGKEPSNAMEE